MFKKTKIAAVTAAVLGVSGMAIAPSAQAVSVNDAGATGQVLVFPYYNVNNGFITSFNITNTTDKYKAVKVRFRESKTSNDVLDFNVYMSPNDMWTMGLSADADGGVRLTSADKTCTHPAFPAGGVAFRGAGIYDSVTNDDEREGYLEIIEMGEVNQGAKVDMAGTLTGPNAADDDILIAADGLLHVAGVPKDCGVVEAAWQQGVFVQGGAGSNGDTTVANDIHTVDPKANGYPNNAALGGGTASVTDFYGLAPTANSVGAIDAPTGGLMGSGILLDLVNVAGFVYEPVAVVNYSSVAQHYLSSDENFYLLPSLASGDETDADNVLGDFSGITSTTWGPVARDIGLDDTNVLPRTSVPSGINPFPMAHAMAVTSIKNQYVLTGDAKTDWVTAAPMKKHGVWNDFEYVAPAAGNTSLATGDIAIADDAVANGYWKFLDAKDVNAEFSYFDREEGFDQPDVAAGDFSPPLPSGTVDADVPFSNEVNILALSAAGATSGSVLGSNNAQGLELATGFTTGWGTFDFSSYNLDDARYTAWAGTGGTTAAATAGVPLSGFVAVQGGVGAGNLGETFPHVLGRN